MMEKGDVVEFLEDYAYAKAGDEGLIEAVELGVGGWDVKVVRIETRELLAVCLPDILKQTTTQKNHTYGPNKQFRRGERVLVSPRALNRPNDYGKVKGKVVSDEKMPEQYLVSVKGESEPILLHCTHLWLDDSPNTEEVLAKHVRLDDYVYRVTEPLTGLKVSGTLVQTELVRGDVQKGERSVVVLSLDIGTGVPRLVSLYHDTPVEVRV